MDSSQRRIAANRNNALKSTGPQSAEGKARSSQNARVHGLLARDPVHPKVDSSADRAEFEQLSARTIAWFRPIGQIEEILVDKISVAAWRMKKALRFERACVTREPRPKPEDFDYMQYAVRGLAPSTPIVRQAEYEHEKRQEELAAWKPARKVLPDDEQLKLLLRYEGAANRDFYRAMAELRRIRKEDAERRDSWVEPELNPSLDQIDDDAGAAPNVGDENENSQTNPIRENAAPVLEDSASGYAAAPPEPQVGELDPEDETLAPSSAHAHDETGGSSVDS